MKISLALLSLCFFLSLTANANEWKAKYALDSEGRKAYSYHWDQQKREGRITLSALGQSTLESGSLPVVTLVPIENLGCSFKGEALVKKMSNGQTLFQIKLAPKGYTCEYAMTTFLYESRVVLQLGSEHTLAISGTPFQPCAGVDSCDKKNGALAQLVIQNARWLLSGFDGQDQYWRDPRTGLAWGGPQKPWSLNQAEATAFCKARGQRLPTSGEVIDDQSSLKIFRLIKAPDTYWTSSVARADTSYPMAWNFSQHSLGYVGADAKYGALCVSQAP
jgi:hypothetical protein